MHIIFRITATNDLELGPVLPQNCIDHSGDWHGAPHVRVDNVTFRSNLLWLIHSWYFAAPRITCLTAYKYLVQLSSFRNPKPTSGLLERRRLMVAWKVPRHKNTHPNPYITIAIMDVKHYTYIILALALTLLISTPTRACLPETAVCNNNFECCGGFCVPLSGRCQ